MGEMTWDAYQHDGIYMAIGSAANVPSVELPVRLKSVVSSSPPGSLVRSLIWSGL